MLLTCEPSTDELSSHHIRSVFFFLKPGVEASVKQRLVYKFPTQVKKKALILRDIMVLTYLNVVPTSTPHRRNRSFFFFY